MINLKKEKKGFSLAEALITLLIVCLITLASIPILTKKKRDLSDNRSGRWICSQHSLGHLVHWQKGISIGNEDNPDEWDAGCKFAPPNGARNFAITVVGSGGGGASGVSAMEKIIDTQNGDTSYTPDTDGEYYVVVIGGGGGGARGYYIKGHKCDHSAGGAGAAGSVFAGKVKLYRGNTYILQKGNGGAKCEKSDYNGCCRDTHRAGKGGDSKFYTEGSNNLVITAYGGQGGVDIQAGGGSFWCRDKCRGGSGGSSPALPKVVINNTDKTNQFLNDGESILQRGEAGEKGGCRINSTKLRNVYYTTGGRSFPLWNLDINSGASYGGGGNGSYGNRLSLPGGGYKSEYNYMGMLSDGYSGYVGLYKIVRKQGQGGGQSEPVQVTVPSIEGKVEITLGTSVGPDEDGKDTRVELFNKHGSRSRLIVSLGGKKGVALETENNTDGQKSIWTDDGGGIKGDVCKKGRSIPIYDSTDSDLSDYKTVCKKVVCTIDPDFEPNIVPFTYGDPSKSNEIARAYDGFYKVTQYIPSNLEKIFKAIGINYFKYFYSNSTGTGVNYDYFINPLTYFQNEFKLVKSYDNYNKTVKAQGETYYSLYPGDRYCFADARVKYVLDCDEEKMVNTGSTAQRIIGYRQSYDCPDAGSASRNAFGAGGGGGYAPAVKGFAGQGGWSAPGAVIIEW